MNRYTVRFARKLQHVSSPKVIHVRALDEDAVIELVADLLGTREFIVCSVEDGWAEEDACAPEGW